MKKDDYRDRIMYRDAQPKVFGYARENREQETPAEKALWEHLKNKQFHGLKWRRQHPLGGFILDFYCHSQQLSLELDGEYHLSEEQQKYDAERTKLIESAGIREVRFANDEIMSNMEGVLEKIRLACGIG